MLGVAVGWQIYALTGSALYLGLVGLAQFLPMFLLTLVVGQVVDRYDRRSIARVCQTVEGIAAGALAVGSLTGWQSKESILILMLVVGAARAFEYPSMHALVPGLVPGHLLPRAVAGYASANQAACTVGPALGGLLYLAGPTTVYATAAILFLAAGAVPLPHTDRAATPQPPAGHPGVAVRWHILHPPSPRHSGGDLP